MKHILLMVLFCAGPFTSWAGVQAFLGKASEKVFIQSTPSLGKNMHLIKLVGIDSKWADHPILVKKEAGSDRYSFDYELDLSTGVIKRTYQILVGNGKDLIKGSLVDKMQVFFQEGDSRHPLEVRYDADLTKESEKMDMLAEHKKSPFKPVVKP